MDLVVATRNAHKLAEIREMLADAEIRVLDLDAFPDAPEVVEDRNTFDGNARKKAVELAVYTGHWALADDSGLEVDALNGAPGVYSARYAGEPADHAANNRKLLAALAGETNRRARFRCVIALASPDGACRTVAGTCEGHMADSFRGEKGFGYDPLFIPDGYAVTFAELSQSEKNGISHRGRALAAARDVLFPAMHG